MQKQANRHRRLTADVTVSSATVTKSTNSRKRSNLLSSDQSEDGSVSTFYTVGWIAGGLITQVFSYFNGFLNIWKSKSSET
jgi:hypothetical protein